MKFYLKSLVAICFFACFLEGSLYQQNELIQDYSKALELIEDQKEQNPSELLDYMKLIARQRGFAEALTFFKQNKDRLFENELTKRKAVEILSWQKLKEGFANDAMETKQIALIGAALQNDIQSLPFIEQAIVSSNERLAALSLHLSRYYLDDSLWDKLCYAFEKSSSINWKRQLIAIAVDAKPRKMEALVLKELEKKGLPYDYQLACLDCLFSLQEQPALNLIEKFSPPIERARDLLKLRLFAFHDSSQLLDLITQNLHSKDVVMRQASMRYASLLPKEQLGSLVFELTKRLDSSSLDEQLFASFAVLSYQDSPKAQELLLTSLKSTFVAQASLACRLLLALGEKGAYLLSSHLKDIKEPFIQINAMKAALEYAFVGDDFFAQVERILSQEKGWDTQSFLDLPYDLESMEPYDASRASVFSDRNFLLVQNRLSFLLILSHYNQDLARKGFKKTIVSLGTKQLDQAIFFALKDQLYNPQDLLEGLRGSEEEAFKFEETLILASLFEDPESYQYLLEVYDKQPYSNKVKVLQAMYSLADVNDWDFLLKELEEPFGQLSLFSAATLLKSARR